MEFEHVGSHCSLTTCKQKDFLPFTCDSCHRNYCLAHRSYDAHGCDGGVKKDMTSLDCPLCGKSVKFDKSKDPHEVWDSHYSVDCTRQRIPSSEATQQHCARKGCPTHLGPSNTYQCPKCLKKVCLSHRMSEEHECIPSRTGPSSSSSSQSKRHLPIASNNPRQALSKVETKPSSTTSNNPREAFLQRVEARSISSSNKRPASSTASKSTAKPKSPKTAPYSSSMPPPSSAVVPSDNSGSNSSNSFSCPMCGNQCSSLEDLSRHVENHLMNDQQQSNPPPLPSSSTVRNNNASSGDIERCPICSQLFSDPVELINHVELVHNHSQQNNNNNNGTNNQTNCVLA